MPFVEIKRGPRSHAEEWPLHCLDRLRQAVAEGWLSREQFRRLAFGESADEARTALARIDAEAGQ